MTDLDLLVLGDANPDLILTGDVEPAFGQVERLVDRADLVVGGSGAITACAATRLGLRTALVAVLGDDVFGRFMLEALGSRGVGTSGCVVDARRSTGVSVVLSRGEDRAILTFPGAIAALRGDLVDRALLASARHVHVSSYYLQTDLWRDLPEIFHVVRDAGGTTSVDPNWDPAGAWGSGLRELLGRTDVFLPNANEACAVAGTDDVEGAATSLAERSTVVAVKLGPDGGLAVRGVEAVRVDAVPVDPVDTTGAGDTFDAGFLSGYIRGRPLRRCLEAAVAAGSLSTGGIGGTGAQPSMAEVSAALGGGG